MSSVFPFLVSGDLVYDMIMGDIEPELLTSELPLLQERYASETPEQHEARMERYRRAYDAFDAEFKKRSMDWNQSFHSYRMLALGEEEQKDRAQEQAAVASLERSFS